MATYKESGKDGREWEINEEYSNRDFTNMTFTDADPAIFNNKVILNSCFEQVPIVDDPPPYHVFPNGIENVRVIGSNLNNVFLEAGMDISEDGWNRNSYEMVLI
jgi:hypothetical protein